MTNSWNLLAEMLQMEAPGDDEFSDDELDAMTSPQKSFANPFEPHAKTVAKVQPPATKPTMTTKPGSMAPPAPKDDFGQAVNPNAVRKGSSSIPAKPQYQGKFVGQRFQSNAKVGYANTKYEKQPGSGEYGYGRVPTQQKQEVVWDGENWITPSAFNVKAKLGQLKKK